MLLGDGIVTIYRQEDTAQPGEMPEYAYYTAMAHDDRTDMLIEVQRTRELSPATDRAEIGGAYYRITQVQQVTDDDGLPMTDLALERVNGLE